MTAATDDIPEGVKIAARVWKELDSGHVLEQHYPQIVRIGIEKGEVHSNMLSFLVCLGNYLGFSSVVDSPLFDKSLGIITERDRAKRPDSIWFRKDDHVPLVIFEFERAGRGLKEKAENMIIMNYDAKDQLQLIVFMYWTVRGDKQPIIRDIVTIFSRNLVKNNSIFPIPSCPVMITKCSMQRATFKRLRLSTFRIMDLLIHGRSQKGLL